MATNKQWAAQYLLDPLNEPDPSDDTGPGASLRPVNGAPITPPKSTEQSPKIDTKASPVVGIKEQPTGSSTFSSNNPYRNRSGSNPSKSNGARTHTRSASGASAGSNRSTEPFPSNYREHAFAEYDPPPRRSAEIQGSPRQGTSSRRRTSSLKERYPGDTSVNPLATINQEHKAANRSPHLRKKHVPGADTIDQLDMAAGLSYHHEGPYDAASLARNNSYESSPLAALGMTNAEALKATPRENVKDSVERHRPLDGTAIIPPGQQDMLGRRYEYTEGDNMMIVDGGNYKRWPGMTYHPDDIKGKGEPSYSIEKALKEHGYAADGSAEGMEMKDHPTHSAQEAYADDGGSPTTSGRRGHGSRLSGEIRRRIGSLKKK